MSVKNPQAQVQAIIIPNRKTVLNDGMKPMHCVWPYNWLLPSLIITFMSRWKTQIQDLD